jgi:hypothetical protein
LVFRQDRNAAMPDMVRQAVQRNRYRISDEQLDEIFTNRTSVPPDMFWILLTEEAQAAGIRLSNEEVGQLLERLIPQLFQKQTYAQVIPTIMNRFSVPEEKILTTFGKLLAVLQYAQVISSLENVTTAQIKHLASRESESLEAEFVPFKASYFVDKSQTPGEQAVLEQFNRYKAGFPGEVNEANPFGFGYRLPDRVQFDYLALKLADVAAIIKPVTDEETEQYYQQNRDRQFTDQVPSDANDPNSPQVAKVRSYAEVSDTIASQLRWQRITTRAEQILQEARSLADANLPAPGPQGRKLTAEQRAAKEDEYTRIAAKLGKDHNLPLYSGRTGLLSTLDVQGDTILRRMFLTTYGYNPIPLSQVLFSVKELGDQATILLSLPPAELYASIGPARDPMSMPASDLANQVMMIARVVQVEKSTPPENVDAAFSTRTVGLGAPSDPKKEVFSVREQVVNDVKALAAWDTTKSKAEEFLALATKDGWDRAVAQFNQLYGAQAKAEPNDPNVFAVERQMGLQRISEADLQVLAAQVGRNPAAPIVLNQARNESQFVERLYSLIPAQSTTPPQMPLLAEFQPTQSYYAVKSLSVQRLTREDFQKSKGMVTLREEYSQIESLAAVHFSPENIVQRLHFRFAQPTDEAGTGEANEAKQQSKDAS